VAGQVADRELTVTPAPRSGETYALATHADDAAIRALLRETGTPGSVHLAFTREPDYFAADGLGGSTDYTVLHRIDGRLEGIGRLSAHTLHRNGRARRIAYLAELRVRPSARHGMRRLREGYEALAGFARAEPLEACFTSIAAENVRARRVLEQGTRFGLPEYLPLADFVTLLVPVRRGGQAPEPMHVDREELTEFLQRHAVAAQLTLTWDAARWEALARHGLGPAEFAVVRAGGRIVAAGAVWDQRAYRQAVVLSYAGALRWLRPAVNVLAASGLAPPLPPVGSVLGHGAIFAAAADEPWFWRPLLDDLRAAAIARGLDWLVIGRDARDPELGVLRRTVGAREYHTRLYDVRWPHLPARAPWDRSPFRPEVALL
jgi:hypothetical protein